MGARSVVATSEGAKASEAVGGGRGRLGAKARSARATERSVRTVRVREGRGGVPVARWGEFLEVEIEAR